MSSCMRNSDATILTEIVNSANQRYLRESRVNQKPSFNILRVLSAYRDICQDFPLRKEQIYNWIIYITKNYNPQSYAQWINSVNTLSSHSINPSKSQTLFKVEKSQKLEKNRRLSTAVNEFYRECISYESNLSSQDQPTNRSKEQYQDCVRSRNFYSYDDVKIVRPVSSKMHYISFEPDQDNKENLNSENMREQNQPVRTPGEQSFIHNLPSQGSPFLTSKITNHTKDITEAEFEDSESLKEWEAMKARADIFYAINTKMKAFSAILANFQAYEEYQNLMKKSTAFIRHQRFSKFFNIWKSLIEVKKQEQRVENLMSLLYSNKLLKKSMKILKINYCLKIDFSKEQRQADLKKSHNRVFYDFIIHLFLTSNMKTEIDDSKGLDTPKSIKHKGRHYRDEQNAEKMQIILENFGAHCKLTQSQIKHLFDLQKKSWMKKCFEVLSGNADGNHKKALVIQRMRIANTFNAYRNIISLKNKKNAKLTVMNTSMNRKVKSKVFKGLLQIVLSKKIYAKREEYLKRKNLNQLKRSVIEYWMHQLEIKQMKKLTLQVRVKQGAEHLRLIFLRKQFSILQEFYTSLKLEEEEANLKRKQNTEQLIFNFLKSRVKQKKIYLQIREKANRSNLLARLRKWKEFGTLTKAAKIIARLIKKISFHSVKQFSEFSSRSENFQKQIKLRLHQNVFHKLRLSFKLDQEEQSQNIAKVQTKAIKSMELQILLRGIHRQKRQQQIFALNRAKEEKTNILKNMSEKWQIQSWFHKLKANKVDQLSHQIKCNTVDKFIKNAETGQTQILLPFRYQRHQIQQGISFLRLCAIASGLRKKVKHCVMMNAKQRFFYNLDSNAESKKLRHLLDKKKESKARRLKKIVFSEMKIRWSAQQEKMSNINENRRAKILYQGLLLLAQEVMKKDKKVASVKDVIKQMRAKSDKQRLLHRLLQNLRLQAKKMHLRKLIGVKKIKGRWIALQNQQASIEAVKSRQLLSCFDRLKSFQNGNFKEKAKMEEYACKKIAVIKLNHSLVREVLRKKALYMSIKFKAINICKKAFEALRNSQMKNKNTLVLKYNRRQEISTQYSIL